MMKQAKRFLVLLVVFCLTVVVGTFGSAGGVEAQDVLQAGDGLVTAAFSYQGELQDAAGPVTDNCDFQFSLWGAESDGSQVGDVQTVAGLAVTGGQFSARLNDAGQFGAGAFTGDARWLQIAVRCPAGAETFGTLSPRQPVTAVPYALYALNGSQGLKGDTGAPGVGFRTDCATDQIAKWDGSAWVCAVDQSAALEARVAALEALLVHLTRSGNDLTISGANLHIVNGLDNTETSNGLGNLIIGYNEERTDGPNVRSGSHTLVVGKENNFSGYRGNGRWLQKHH